MLSSPISNNGVPKFWVSWLRKQRGMLSENRFYWWHICFSVMTIALGSTWGNVKALRAFRVLRPLRLVSGVPSMQFLVLISCYSFHFISLFWSILFQSIPSNYALFFYASILFHFILLYSIPFHSILFYSILYYILFFTISFYLFHSISLFPKEIVQCILGSFGGTKYMETCVKYVKE
jgi:hypothetical protein